MRMRKKMSVMDVMMDKKNENEGECVRHGYVDGQKEKE
jgi:hypothetical protein